MQIYIVSSDGIFLKSECKSSDNINESVCSCLIPLASSN